MGGDIQRKHREGAGKSDHSWIKHDLAAKAVGAQIGAFRRLFPQARIILIDGNAGDGDGVELKQFDLFAGVQKSRSTAQLLCDLADEHGATLCLCERDRAKRHRLALLFPAATIVANHAEAASLALTGFNYALWLSDPCGYAGHGVQHMRKVATQILRSDYIIIMNELALKRVVGAKGSAYWQPHQKYTPMLTPAWWLGQLPKRFLARTPVINQSSGFHFRLMVVSNYITNGVKRLRDIEIIPR
jgi:hypothetical protein